jgi:hypothetical protein
MRGGQTRVLRKSKATGPYSRLEGLGRVAKSAPDAAK